MMTPTTLWTHSRIKASSQRADVPRKPYLREGERFISILYSSFRDRPILSKNNSHPIVCCVSTLMRKLEAHPSSMANTQGLKSPNFSSWKNCSDTRFFSLCVLSNLKSYPFVFICLVVFKVAVNIRDQIPEQELNTFWRKKKTNQTIAKRVHETKKLKRKQSTPVHVLMSQFFTFTFLFMILHFHLYSLFFTFPLFYSAIFSLSLFFTQDLAVKESSVYRHLMSTIVVNMSLEMKSVKVIFEKVTKLRIWENMFANMKIPW